MRKAKAILRLTRPPSTVLAFLAILTPLSVRTGDIEKGFGLAMPMLFIAMCTFIVNDIDDIEVDKVNHPERPLPSGDLVPSLATVAYFISLTVALFSTKILVPGPTSFYYYALLILAINYKYVTQYLPSWKAPYVALASGFPVMITAGLISGDGALYLVAVAASVFVLGRELLLDHLDRAGDPTSLMSTLSRRSITTLAFSLQALGLLLLALLVQTFLDLLALGLLATLSLPALLVWVKGPTPGRATEIMKVQMYGGLYFLLR